MRLGWAVLRRGVATALAASAPLLISRQAFAEEAPALIREDPVESDAPSFLGPAGVLAESKQAVWVAADTELPGYPAVELGYRYGIGGFADIGVEAQIADVAVLGRLSSKFRLYEDTEQRAFISLRFRLELKKQRQEVTDETFRDIDDFGFVVAPELGIAYRLDPRRQHALHYFTYVYLDFDVRPDKPFFEWYYAPIVVGYEYHNPIGFHVLADTGVGWEVGNPETFGELIPRFRLAVGWEY